MGGRGKYRVLGAEKSFSSSSSSNSSSTKKSSGRIYKESNNSTVPVSCMSGVFQFFDFHQLQLSSLNHNLLCFKPPNNSSLIHQEKQVPNLPNNGPEPPRNSSETEIKDEDFGFPVGIRVQTRKKGRITDFSSLETSNSPSIKTPTLVARLMGLDILPETISSSSSSSLPSSQNSNSSKTHNRILLQDSINDRFGSHHHHEVTRNRVNDNSTKSRSLPGTPTRISSTRRSDFDPSRLSLQINKENFLMNEEFDYIGGRSSVDSLTSLSSLSSLNKSRKRDIIKQAKDSVSRKMGRDITNFFAPTITTTATTRSTAAPAVSKLQDQNSPRRSKAKKSSLSSPQPPPPPPVGPAPPQLIASRRRRTQPLPKQQTIDKCKRASCERYTQRKEVVSVRKSPAASKQEYLNIPLDHKVPQKQKSQSSPTLSKEISIIPSPTLMDFWKEEHRFDKLIVQVAEFRYVNRILKCMGIETNSNISSTKWYSLSHPLDPSIFTHLEDSFISTGSLRNRSNRRLIFNLVDEILSEILIPYLNTKPGLMMNSRNIVKKLARLKGGELIKKLWVEIKNSPLSNCQILQDIDALIEKDLPSPSNFHANILSLSVFEEGESIVLEIERDIVDSLVHEVVLAMIFHESV